MYHFLLIIDDKNSSIVLKLELPKSLKTRLNYNIELRELRSYSHYICEDWKFNLVNDHPEYI